MSGYGIVLFVHLCALIAAFAASALGHFAEGRMGAAATVGEVRSWAGLLGKLSRTFPIAVVVLFGSGAYMVQSKWAWSDGWIVAGLAGIVAMAMNGPLVIGNRMRRLRRCLAAAGEGRVGDELARLVRDPVLHAATWGNTGLGLGIVLVMTVKPTLAPSIVVLVVALALGAALSVPFAKSAAVAAGTSAAD